MASVNDEGDIDDSVPTGNPLIDGLLTEYHWSHLARVNFQFTIPDSETDYEDTRDLLVDDYPDDNHIGVQAMAAWMAGGVRDAIAEFNNILNFQITEQADNNVDTQLRYAVADLTHDGDQPPPPAYAWTPQDDGLTSEQDNWKSGDMFYNKDRFAMQDQPGTELVGTYQYHTILHETGHALGLKHGHEADHDNPALPVVAHELKPLGSVAFRERRDVMDEAVDMVGADALRSLAEAVAAHVRRDDVEASGGERSDLAPPRPPDSGNPCSSINSGPSLGQLQRREARRRSHAGCRCASPARAGRHRSDHEIGSSARSIFSIR